jgi:hypothetical protein
VNLSIDNPLTPTSNPITPLAFNSIGVKWKQSNVFSLVLEAMDKNNKIIIDVRVKIL